MSDEQRWIDQALELKSELPAQVTISWEAYCALVKGRDQAREQLETAKKASIWCTCDECGFYRSDGQQMRRERDEAQRVARIAFKWAGGEHMSESPKGLVHELEDALDVEDYTQFPDWLTGGRGY